MGKLFPDPFLKNQNWAYLWINSLKFYAVCFYCMPRWELSKYILKLSCRPLAFTSYTASSKNKKKTGTSAPSSFCAWFLKKNISVVVLLIDQISLSGCLYFVRYLALCVLQLFDNQAVTLWILKLILLF